MLVSTIDDATDLRGPEGDIIMILSSDKGILHPISLLMLRGHTIYLVVPDQFDLLEASRATRVFDWNTDVLDLKPSKGPGSVFTSNMGRTGEAGASAAHLRANKRKQGPFDAPTVRDAPPYRGSPQAPNPLEGDKGYPYPFKSPKDATQQPLLPRTTSSMSPGLFKEPGNDSTTPNTGLTTVASRSDSLSSRTPSVLSQRSGNQQSKLDIASNGKAQGVTMKSPQMPLGHLQSSMPPPERQVEEFPLKDDWGFNSGWNEGGGWESGSSAWSTKPNNEEQVVGLGMVDLAIAGPPPPVSDPPRYPGTPQSEVAAQAAPDDSVFLPLLECLAKAKAEGKNQVLRSVIGADLSRQKDIYRAAGATGFGSYVALAAERGYISLGGAGGKEWVALKTD